MTNRIDREGLMMQLQEYSFAVVEAVLYLDTHPSDKDALEYYDKYNSLYNETVEKYERYCGPLTMYAGSNGEKWQWSEDPWPWEYDCRR